MMDVCCGLVVSNTWGMEYNSQEVMVQLYKTLRPHLDYYAVLVAPLQEYCGGFGGGAEVVYWDAAIIWRY